MCVTNDRDTLPPRRTTCSRPALAMTTTMADGCDSPAPGVRRAVHGERNDPSLCQGGCFAAVGAREAGLVTGVSERA